jgi:SOS-response transcriptional repressor LexA
MSLSYVQSRTLSFIERRMKETGGVSPTMEEIASAMSNWNKSAALQTVLELEKKGFISRLPGKARAIALIRSRYGWNSREKLVAFKFDEDLKILVPLEDYRAMKHQKSRKDEDSEIEKSRLG